MKYKRILLKLSGEALSGEGNMGIKNEELLNVSSLIKYLLTFNIELAIVIGGGNFWRGKLNKEMSRVDADYIGMLATVMNSIALSSALKEQGIKNKVLTSINIEHIGENYHHDKALKYLKEKQVLIFAGGTGNPYFSTDTAATLRALEINADLIIKATKVDGIYDSDPKMNHEAKKYDFITYEEIVKKNLQVMDLTSTVMNEQGIPTIVLDYRNEENFKKAFLGEKVGTLISK